MRTKPLEGLLDPSVISLDIETYGACVKNSQASNHTDPSPPTAYDSRTWSSPSPSPYPRRIRVKMRGHLKP